MSPPGPRVVASSVARTVCSSRRAVVTGPTPPGTGVRPLTRAATSGATAPARPPSSVGVVPTSRTIDEGVTCCAVTRRGLPTAATSTSARLQCSVRSRVREWHTVTVASRSSSRWATGFPTTAERPRTIAFGHHRATRTAVTLAAGAGTAVFPRPPRSSARSKWTRPPTSSPQSSGAAAAHRRWPRGRKRLFLAASAITADAAEYFNLHRDRTLIVGSHVEV